MSGEQQIAKAEAFRQLHHEPDLLVLPNVWDPLGARLLDSLGYPAIATASAAVAFSRGVDDGERIELDTMLEIVGQIARSVELPVSADIEAGFAERPAEVAANMRRLLETGAVGINLEDSGPERPRRLYPLELQCERIRAVREMAVDFGVPLVINARVDVFVRPVPESPSEKLAEAVRRGNSYVEAGADCVFPVALGEIETLQTLVQEIDAPINASATGSTPTIAELERAGIARLSLGPGLLKAALTTMRDVAAELREPDGSFARFTRDAMTSAEIEGLVSSD